MLCQRILELDDETIYTYDSNYEYYLEKREQRITAQNANIARANNLYHKELTGCAACPVPEL